MIRRCLPRLAVEKLPRAAVVAAVEPSGPIGSSWRYNEDGDKSSLTREYAFGDFHEAWAFMNGCVPFINEADHHPEWFNVYNRVNVKLTTHDCGNNVSPRDIDMAKEMERVAKLVSKK